MTCHQLFKYIWRISYDSRMPNPRDRKGVTAENEKDEAEIF